MEDPGMEGAEATAFDPERDPLLLYAFTVSSPMCMPEKGRNLISKVQLG